MSVRKKGFAGTQAHVRNALLLGLLVAASQGFSLRQPDPNGGDPGYLLSDWLRDGCVLGLGSLLSGWAFQGLLDRTSKQWLPVLHTHRGLRGRLATWMNTIAPLHIWQAALVFGGGIGLSLGLIDGLSVGPSAGLSLGLNSGLDSGLDSGLLVGVVVVLAHVILAGTVGSLRFAERIQWTWRGLLRPTHLRTSLIVVGAWFLFFGLFFGLSFGLISWLGFGLGFGLSFGLISGLGFGLSFGLSYWILLGLYQGMKQEHLEDQDRQQFNQGIRRSLRNGLLVGLMSALLISAIRMLSAGLSAGLSTGLIDGLSTGLSLGLILLFPGIVVMWTLSGGLTVLRHYVIRALLARHRIFPWRAQAFLDDATTRILLRRVGGGYSFIHRRLQDYLADAAVPPPQK